MSDMYDETIPVFKTGRLAQPTSDFLARISAVGLTRARLCAEAGVTETSLSRAYNGITRGMHPVTAWKLARAYADAAKVAPEEAFARLFTMT